MGNFIKIYSLMYYFNLLHLISLTELLSLLRQYKYTSKGKLAEKRASFTRFIAYWDFQRGGEGKSVGAEQSKNR